MIFSSKKSLQDSIIEILLFHKFGIRWKEILLQIKQYRPSTTKQALYAALRCMIWDEIIIKMKGVFVLSSLWKSKITQLLIWWDYDFLSLVEGETISYKFKSMLICDRYWAHLDALLIEYVTPKNSNIHFYNPHHWFSLVRKDFENTLIDMIFERKIPLYITLGNFTSIDRACQHIFTKKNITIWYNPNIKYGNTWYCNVFEDFIIEVVITQKIADQIDQWYCNNVAIIEQSLKQLELIIATDAPVRLKITRNKKKALFLSKRFMKIF